MPIRSSIAVIPPKRIPWELEYALEAVNNGYVFGAPKTTVDSLLAEAEGWEQSSRAAIENGRGVYASLCSNHSARYLRAAEALEHYNGARR